jgi:hypothetical protein
VALTTNDYGFERVFAFDPQQPPLPDHYSGHVNGTVWALATGGRYTGPTANFPNEQAEVIVRPGHYICFGDNTMNSSDSRCWGPGQAGGEPDFAQEKVIGRSLFALLALYQPGRHGPQVTVGVVQSARLSVLWPDGSRTTAITTTSRYSALFKLTHNVWFVEPVP